MFLKDPSSISVLKFCIKEVEINEDKQTLTVIMSHILYRFMKLVQTKI